MSIKNVLDFAAMKQKQQAISVLTCYDFTFAQLLNKTNIDCLLVGDSAAMVMHGFKTTVNADMAMLVAHTSAVARGAPDKFIIADLPFLSYRQDLSANMEAVKALMQAGAHAVKLEGAAGNLELIRHIVESGVPVMGHLGLTPQSVNLLGGYRIQAKDKPGRDLLLENALALENAGCFAMVLECVPNEIAAKVSQTLKIPTIGIGAGADTDGQVLVLPDMLGMNPTFQAKFVREFMAGFDLIQKAVNDYVMAVKQHDFPSKDESFV